MAEPYRGCVDCDIHPSVPSIKALLPYMPDFWHDTVVQRGIKALDTISYPQNAPISGRPDWRVEGRKTASSVEDVQQQLLDAWGADYAICNPLYGVQALLNVDMGAAFAQAVNDWLVKEWLDRDERLRASIVIPMQAPDLAVEEINRCAKDPRFVQVLMLVNGEMPLGRRFYWPIYATAERHGLPVGIHAGSSYHHPVTPVGWPSYYTEDYLAQSQAFQSQLASLICEGVFTKYPALHVVLMESGFTWLPSFLWRLDKVWRGLRMEVPWVHALPSEIVRKNVRLTLQPIDAPPTAEQLNRVMDQLESDRLLLFSTDYPHWHFDGTAAMPEGLSPELARRILVDNPRATYSRLGGQA
ncbi:MAG: amidohydrolase family protein [Acetobacterales bacterium]